MESFVQLPGENVDENTLFQLQGLIAKGNALYHSGRHKEAYDYFSNAINKSTGCLKSLNEISPAGKMLLSNLYNRRAASANKLQNYEQVIYDATEMIVLGFQIEKGHVRKGGALLMAGQPGEAVKEYKEALKLNPDNAAYKQYLKEAQEKCGGQSEPAPPPAPLSCPEVQRQNKIHDRTKQGNKVFFAEKPDYVGALDHYDSALKEVGEGEKSDKPTAAIKHNLLGRRAQTLKKLQRFQEAIDDAEQMIELAPESEKGYILKANAYICLAQHALEGGVRAMTTPESREIIQKHMNALEAATFV